MNYLLHNQHTDRIHFRGVSFSDREEWLSFFTDPSSFEYWKMEMESPEVECKKWYDKQFHRYATNHGGMNALIEKSSGQLIGHCGLLVQYVDGKQELEIAYSLLRTFRAKGYATEAALLCKHYAFTHNLADSLISIISLPNEPSANVARKIGMRVDYPTVYNGNAVNIFRIDRSDWLKGIPG